MGTVRTVVWRDALANIARNTAYTSGNVLTNSITVGGKSNWAAKLHIEVVSSAAVSLKISYNNGSNYDTTLNGGAALTANALYKEDIDVVNGDIINFSFSGATTINRFTVTYAND